MVNLNGKFELADLKAAQDLHARPGRWAKWGLYLVLGALGLLLILGIIFGLKGSMSWSTIIYPIFLLGFLALFWFVLRPYQITRSYKQHKELSSPFEMELSDEGYAIKNSYGSGKIPWKDFAKWKADKKIILLYRTDNMFNMVPRRLLQDESQAQYVIDQLRLNNVKEASQVRNPVRTVAWAVVAVLLLVVMALLVYINIR